MNDKIERDSISDRIGTALWYVVAFLACGVAFTMPIAQAIPTLIIGIVLAYGVYYVITGRGD